MAYLTLDDGTAFEGESFGYVGEAMGKVVSNTAMTGYQEIITHPTSYGQLINMTYPLIGNYGVNEEDVQSDYVHARGLIVRDYCNAMSNWRASESLADYMKRHNIVGIHSIDTRSLCQKLRKEGERRGIITEKRATHEQLQLLNNCSNDNILSEVSTKCEYEIIGKRDKRIAIIDYGLNRSLLNSIVKLGFSVKIFPHNSVAECVMSYNPQGIILSNGPSDPRVNKGEIATIQALLNRDIAILGIGLGHLLLALAKGAGVYELKRGTRGTNQPIKELGTNRLYTTVQNQGYTVDSTSLTMGRVTHINCNDNSIRGIDYDKKCYSLQFEPREVVGPQNTVHLFDKFRHFVESGYGKR